MTDINFHKVINQIGEGSKANYNVVIHYCDRPIYRSVYIACFCGWGDRELNITINYSTISFYHFCIAIFF